MKKRFKNRYFITLVVFFLWMLFFDNNSLVNQIKLRDELDKAMTKKKYYFYEIKRMKSQLKDLETDKEALEKLAREKYLMKKENEDIFLILRDEDK
ncbi:MAG: septum formation initiator family protein [Hyphomicrobiales bacterium]